MVINDIAGFGCSFKDIAELYKTDEGYVVEGPDGEPLEVVSSPRKWHRRARAFNAKAKPVETFFRTLERILRDLGTPGLVKELKGLSEEKALADKRLKKLIKENKLLTVEEFIVKLFEAVEIYNHRRHSKLRRSPMDELWRAVKEGFTPTYLVEDEVDFILLPRIRRKVQRGRILLNHVWYEGDPLTPDNLEAGLWHLPDKTEIEVRYDPFDPAKVIAVLPDGSIRYLHPVPVSSMKDRQKTSELMSWKREMMRAVTEHYKRLTRPVPGIVEYSKRTKQAKEVARQQRRGLSEVDFEQIQREAEQMVRESMEDKKVVPIVAKRPVFRNEWEYYKWCLDMELSGKRLSAKDRAFMADYESRMDEDERQYWEIHRRIYTNKQVEGGKR